MYVATIVSFGGQKWQSWGGGVLVLQGQYQVIMEVQDGSRNIYELLIK